MPNRMTTAHLLCGLPGSGKTTFAIELEETQRAVRYSHDEWLAHLFGRRPPKHEFETHYRKVADLIWQNASRNLVLGNDVIFDYGFWRRKDRDAMRESVRLIGAESRLYYLDAPIDVLKARVLSRTNEDENSLWINEDAFSSFVTQFERPNENENFEHIWTG